MYCLLTNEIVFQCDTLWRDPCLDSLKCSSYRSFILILSTMYKSSTTPIYLPQIYCLLRFTVNTDLPQNFAQVWSHDRGVVFDYLNVFSHEWLTWSSTLVLPWICQCIIKWCHETSYQVTLRQRASEMSFDSHIAIHLLQFTYCNAGKREWRFIDAINKWPSEPRVYIKDIWDIRHFQHVVDKTSGHLK